MNKKILIIEDEKKVRENITTLLTEENYTVISSKDGEGGIETAIKERPDLIICDIMMPGIDGYGVLEILSKNEVTKSTPFIFLTAKIFSVRIFPKLSLLIDSSLKDSIPWTSEKNNKIQPIIVFILKFIIKFLLLC